MASAKNWSPYLSIHAKCPILGSMMSFNMQLEASLSVIDSATKVTRKTNTCMLIHVFNVMVSNIEAFLTNITIEAIKSCVNLHVAEEARLCRVISVTFRALSMSNGSLFSVFSSTFVLQLVVTFWLSGKYSEIS